MKIHLQTLKYMSFLFQKRLIALLYFYVCVHVIYSFMCVCVLIAACVRVQARPSVCWSGSEDSL